MSIKNEDGSVNWAEVRVNPADFKPWGTTKTPEVTNDLVKQVKHHIKENLKWNQKKLDKIMGLEGDMDNYTTEAAYYNGKCTAYNELLEFVYFIAD